MAVSYSIEDKLTFAQSLSCSQEVVVEFEPTTFLLTGSLYIIYH